MWIYVSFYICLGLIIKQNIQKFALLFLLLKKIDKFYLEIFVCNKSVVFLLKNIWIKKNISTYAKRKYDFQLLKAQETAHSKKKYM